MGQPVIVHLTRGLVAKISPIDATRVLQHKWFANQTNRAEHGIRFYAGRAVRIDMPDGTRKKTIQYLHRFITGTTNPKLVVDHFNGDTLDYQRDNLVVSNKGWNSHNKDQAIGITGYRGVSMSGIGRYRARFMHLGDSIHIGIYPTAREAAEAYDAKAIELLGPMARTNLREGRLDGSQMHVPVPALLGAAPAMADVPF